MHRWVSLLGAAMSGMYSIIAFAASVAAGVQGASYELRTETQWQQIFGAFNALGTIMFAFGGHAILLEVQVCHWLGSTASADLLPSSTMHGRLRCFHNRLLG